MQARVATLISGAGVAEINYQGVAVKYSGYNGVNKQKGNEYIHLGKGAKTNRDLVMRAFGYAAGEATVKYTWQAPSDCVDTGCGDFEQLIQSKAIVKVGDIPAGKDYVKIYLYSAADVDVQLYDEATGAQRVVVRARRRIDQGEELLNSYDAGELAPAKFLTRFGFVPGLSTGEFIQSIGGRKRLPFGFKMY